MDDASEAEEGPARAKGEKDAEEEIKEEVTPGQREAEASEGSKVQTGVLAR